MIYIYRSFYIVSVLSMCYKIKKETRLFFQRLYSLKHAPIELWLAYFLKFLESYAYFSMSVNFVLFLSDEYGFSDLEAGTMYGIWGLLITLYGFVTGIFIDKLGVKKSLVVGGLLSIIGRAIFSIFRAKWIMFTSVCFFMPCGFSLAIPVLSIGIKRYTNENNRTLCFAIFYSCMNIAAVFSGPITDYFVQTFGTGIIVLGFHLSALRLVFLTGTLSTILYTTIAAFAFREIDVDSSGKESIISIEKKNTLETIKRITKDRVFYSLMGFSVILVGVNMIFRYLDAAFPTYAKRELGSDVPYGTLYSINPAIIVFLVPVLSGFLAKYDPYKCIIVGTCISASSVFFMCLGSYYISALLFIVFLSLGEATYSPRVYEYTLLVSPKGEEGIYAMMATAPMFLTKLFVGMLSGGLLQVYCPEEGPRRCWMVWFITGCIAITSPICLIIFSKCIHGEAVKKRIEQERLKNNSGEIYVVPEIPVKKTIDVSHVDIFSIE